MDYEITDKVSNLIKQYSNVEENRRSTLLNTLSKQMNYFIKFFSSNKEALIDGLTAWQLLNQFKLANPDSNLDPSVIYSNCGIYKFEQIDGLSYCIINKPDDCTVKFNNSFIYVKPVFYYGENDYVIKFLITDNNGQALNDGLTVEVIAPSCSTQLLTCIIESFDKLITYVEQRKFYYNFKSVKDELNKNLKEIESSI
jgi:hypothetical protein